MPISPQCRTKRSMTGVSFMSISEISVCTEIIEQLDRIVNVVEIGGNGAWARPVDGIAGSTYCRQTGAGLLYRRALAGA
jgi:hypothetical protein